MSWIDYRIAAYGTTDPSAINQPDETTTSSFWDWLKSFKLQIGTSDAGTTIHASNNGVDLGWSDIDPRVPANAGGVSGIVVVLLAVIIALLLLSLFWSKRG